MSLEFVKPAGVDDDDSDFASITENISAGDQYMDTREFSDAESSYNSALVTAFDFYGALSPVLLPIILKVVDAQLADCQDEDHFAHLTRSLQRALAIAQLKFGPESQELIPIIEKMIAVYDLQGAHMLSAELLQRLQVLNETAQG
ncbi:MAG: hypothetical protein SGJ27_26925 [Candidatus Melainabacteria bacterium]|nr:hypothetical protein [Candidatus Melainabacteria bacterium]